MVSRAGGEGGGGANPRGSGGVGGGGKGKPPTQAQKDAALAKVIAKRDAGMAKARLDAKKAELRALKERVAARSEKHDREQEAIRKNDVRIGKEIDARQYRTYTKAQAEKARLKALYESGKPAVSKTTVKVVQKVKAKTADEAKARNDRMNREQVRTERLAADAAKAKNEAELFKRLERGFYKGKAKPE